MNVLSYPVLELSRWALAPARAYSKLASMTLTNPVNPLAHTSMGRNLAASAELFGQLTHRYGKPEFGLATTLVNGEEVGVVEETLWRRPFCSLLHFRRVRRASLKPLEPQPRLLIVAPMSGHHATLLRGTVETFLPDYEVIITDWTDARLVPGAAGRFDLDDYIDYIIEMCAFLHGADPAPLHLLVVCQSSVPVLAAVARMEAQGDLHIPASMTLMGGPIDTRRQPTAVDKFARERDLDWFRRNCIHTAPFPYPGMGRAVYPGFLQLSGFLAMNFDRHVAAYREMFNHLVEGDGEAAEKHRKFYDEYLAVMDLTAEFYLQTIDTVFLRHALATGEMTHRGEIVDPAAIARVGLMTIEGEKDDISGIGQTYAAQKLCAKIPATLRAHHLQMGVGHYGVFNGSRFRDEIAPRIRAFHARLDFERKLERSLERKLTRGPAGGSPLFRRRANLPNVRQERRSSDIVAPTRRRALPAPMASQNAVRQSGPRRKSAAAK